MEEHLRHEGIIIGSIRLDRRNPEPEVELPGHDVDLSDFETGDTILMSAYRQELERVLGDALGKTIEMPVIKAVEAEDQENVKALQEKEVPSTTKKSGVELQESQVQSNEKHDVFYNAAKAIDLKIRTIENYIYTLGLQLSYRESMSMTRERHEDEVLSHLEYIHLLRGTIAKAESVLTQLKIQKDLVRSIKESHKRISRMLFSTVLRGYFMKSVEKILDKLSSSFKESGLRKKSDLTWQIMKIKLTLSAAEVIPVLKLKKLLLAALEDMAKNITEEQLDLK